MGGYRNYMLKVYQDITSENKSEDIKASINAANKTTKFNCNECVSDTHKDFTKPIADFSYVGIELLLSEMRAHESMEEAKRFGESLLSLYSHLLDGANVDHQTVSFILSHEPDGWHVTFDSE